MLDSLLDLTGFIIPLKNRMGGSSRSQTSQGEGVTAGVPSHGDLWKGVKRWQLVHKETFPGLVK